MKVKHDNIHFIFMLKIYYAGDITFKGIAFVKDPDGYWIEVLSLGQ